MSDDYPDLTYHLDKPEPHEDAEGYEVGWSERISKDAARWSIDNQEGES